MMRSFSILLLVSTLSFGCLFSNSHIHAATGLTIQPIKISQTIDPGGGYESFIKLSNASDDDVVVEVNVEDFIPSAGASGIEFVGRAEGVTSVRDWISMQVPKEVELKKGETLSIGYKINVPADAEPGSHFGVIFFKAIKKSDAEQQLRIGTQVGVLTFVTVTGDFEQSGRIISFGGPGFTQANAPFSIMFENTGTVHFEPKGVIKIKNMFGKEVGAVPVEGQVVLPTGVKELGFAWHPESFIIGKYTANLEIFDLEGNVLAADSTSFYAAPLWYVFIMFIAFLLFLWLVRFLKSRFVISVRR